MKRILAIVFVLLLLVQFGCTKYHIDRTDYNNLPPKLDRTASAYVSICEDGRYNQKLYSGSGMATSQIIMDEFSKYFADVAKGKSPEAYEEALKSALYNGYKYLIFPSIEQWEDHLTEITEIRDKVKVKIIVAETLSGNQLDLAMISGKSKLYTIGGDYPQDLLATLIRIYVDELFE